MNSRARVAAVLLLAACGGGSTTEGPPTDYAPNFVGQWSGTGTITVTGQGTYSESLILRLSKNGTNELLIAGVPDVCPDGSPLHATAQSASTLSISYSCPGIKSGFCPSIVLQVSGSGTLSGTALSASVSGTLSGCGTSYAYSATFSGGPATEGQSACLSRASARCHRYFECDSTNANNMFANENSCLNALAAYDDCASFSCPSGQSFDSAQSQTCLNDTNSLSCSQLLQYLPYSGPMSCWVSFCH